MILSLAAANRNALRDDRDRLSVGTTDVGGSSSLSAGARTPGGRPLSVATDIGGYRSPLSSSTSGPRSPPVHGRTPSLGTFNSMRADYFSPTLPSSQGSPYVENDEFNQSEELLDGSTAATSVVSMRVASAEQPAAGLDLVYVPTAPRSCYGRLLDVCLDFDLEVMKNLAPDEEVSLKILSRPNQDLLAACAERWRVPPQAQAVAFFDEIVKRYTTDEVPLVQCVLEAIDDVYEANDVRSWDDWMMQDVRSTPSYG